jgi:membrane protein implicated in regulation of membrane protease activity
MSAHQPARPGDNGPLRTYIVASLPGWLVTAAIAFFLSSRGHLPLWGAVAIAGALIGMDLLLFPRRRHYYTSEPANSKMIGEQGVAASDLAPRGLVRVHGELWQAAAMRPEPTIREGDLLLVREVHGLELIVERRDDNRPAPLPISS